MMSVSLYISAQNYGGTITLLSATLKIRKTGFRQGPDGLPACQRTVNSAPSLCADWAIGDYPEDSAKVQAENGMSGFINDNGKIVVEMKYDEIGKFGEYKENRALVSTDGKYGFIDKSGKEVVKPQYAESPLKKK